MALIGHESPNRANTPFLITTQQNTAITIDRATSKVSTKIFQYFVLIDNIVILLAVIGDNRSLITEAIN